LVQVARVYTLQNKKLEALDAYEEAQSIQERDEISKLMAKLSLSEADKIAKATDVAKDLVEEAL
jgi:hypothetical protein